MNRVNILQYVCLFPICWSRQKDLNKSAVTPLIGTVGSFSMRPIFTILPEETPDTTSLHTSICCTSVQVFMARDSRGQSFPLTLTLHLLLQTAGGASVSAWRRSSRSSSCCWSPLGPFTLIWASAGSCTLPSLSLSTKSAPHRFVN